MIRRSRRWRRGGSWSRRLVSSGARRTAKVKNWRQLVSECARQLRCRGCDSGRDHRCAFAEVLRQRVLEGADGFGLSGHHQPILHVCRAVPWICCPLRCGKPIGRSRWISEWPIDRSFQTHVPQQNRGDFRLLGQPCRLSSSALAQPIPRQLCLCADNGRQLKIPIK